LNAQRVFQGKREKKKKKPHCYLASPYHCCHASPHQEEDAMAIPSIQHGDFLSIGRRCMHCYEVADASHILARAVHTPTSF